MLVITKTLILLRYLVSYYVYYRIGKKFLIKVEFIIVFLFISIFSIDLPVIVAIYRYFSLLDSLRLLPPVKNVLVCRDVMRLR